MNAVLSQGGLHTTKDELDQLCSGKAEDLKDQIRYRKLLMVHGDLRLAGSVATLYKTFLKKICNESPARKMFVKPALGKRQSCRVKVLMMKIKYNILKLKMILTETFIQFKRKENFCLYFLIV